MLCYVGTNDCFVHNKLSGDTVNSTPRPPCRLKMKSFSLNQPGHSIRAANSHGFAVWHTLLHVFTRSHATSNFSRQKKSDFGPRRVRSFSNSPAVDGAKERICNARFTPGAEAPHRAKESQAPPIHPLLNLCVVHMGCDAPRQGLHRWFRRWVYFLCSTRAYRARKHTEKWF